MRNAHSCYLGCSIHRMPRSEVDILAGDLGGAGGVGFVEAPRFGIAGDVGGHADERAFGQRYMVLDRGVHAEEAILAHDAMPRNDDMRRDERMVADRRVMADVVAAPKDDVVADQNKRLNRVVFEDETVLANRGLGEACCPRADVRNARIPATLEFAKDFSTKSIHTVWRERSEGTYRGGRKVRLQLLERHNRQALERCRLRHVLAMDREPNDAMFAIVLEIEMRKGSEIAGSKDDDIGHAATSVRGKRKSCIRKGRNRHERESGG